MLSHTTVLHVESVSSFREYDTLEQAIEDGRHEMNAGTCHLTIDQVGGQQIEAVEWSDTDALIRFANGKSICLRATLSGVSWHADDSQKINVPDMTYPRRLLLQYPHAPQPVSWERARILERNVGRKFVRLVQSGQNVFFYAEGCEVLLFCALGITGTRERGLLLSWNDAA